VAKKGETPHILVIRLSAMGDVAMTVPVLLALKKKHPEVKITLLTKSHFKSIFSSIDGVTVFSVDVKSKHKGIWGLWLLYRALEPISITHVADVHNVLRSKILGFFFRAKGIPIRKINKGRAEKRALTRAKDKKFCPLKSTIERYIDVFETLGFSLNFEEKYVLPRQAIPEGRLKFENPKSVYYIGIAPFATYESKMYRLDLMEQVIQKILAQGNCKVFLFGGGKHEQQQLKSLESKFNNGVQSIVGKISFEDELALISNLHVMLAMDSGNGHLAANYGIPVVTIWGVTHPFAGFGPYNQPLDNSLTPDRTKYPLIPTSVYGNTYPKAYLEAINSISPEVIVEKVLKVLDKKSS
jgi:ADP-heptose:LPS heptosyltransferase